ncbi:MAG TPA: hypothetical protein PKN54_02300 [Candidatus Cloacimonas acidaminovorans]|nr:hypothetical protein [Candidatus Cloacimonas acidaminovorans]
MNFKTKQTISLLISSAIPITMFVGGLFGTMNLFIGVGCGVLGILPAILIGKGVLKTPMDALLNGQPVAFDLNSSGMLQAYEIKLDLPLMSVKLPNKTIETKFDRKLAIPFNMLIKKKLVTFNEKDEIVFRNEKIDDLMTKQFILNKNATIFLINSQTGSFITKDQLAKMENTLATENLTLYELDLIKNMTRDIRALGKTFVSNLGGQQFFELLKNPLVQGIIIAAVILLIVILVGPMVLDALNIGAGTVQGAGQTIANVPVNRV